nr:hypothetical protein [Tanacetum cinerariifolium]
MGKGSKNHNSGFNSTFAHGNAAGMNPNKAAHGVMGRSGSVTNQGMKLSQSAIIVDVSQQIGVPPDTLKDIDNLTKAIDLGKLEVLLNLPSEKRKEVMETIWAMWDAFLTENLNATSGYSLDSGKSDVGIGGTYEVWSKLTRIQRKAILKTAHDGWIALLELDLASLAAGANNKDQPKVMSNFLHLVAYLVFNAVDISIPHKFVKKVSSWFENTLYGNSIGKRMAFLVVEYYARNN